MLVKEGCLDDDMMSVTEIEADLVENTLAERSVDMVPRKLTIVAAVITLMRGGGG